MNDRISAIYFLFTSGKMQYCSADHLIAILGNAGMKGDAENLIDNQFVEEWQSILELAMSDYNVASSDGSDSFKSKQVDGYRYRYVYRMYRCITRYHVLICTYIFVTIIKWVGGGWRSNV